jgi:hypothetical protein
VRITQPLHSPGASQGGGRNNEIVATVSRLIRRDCRGMLRLRLANATEPARRCAGDQTRQGFWDKADIVETCPRRKSSVQDAG